MSIVIRALDEQSLAEADRIFRVAFGTFLGAPDPERFAGDVDYVRTRWRAEPAGAFGAFDERGLSGADGGRMLIGSNFATIWGRFGFFGPLTVRPDHWDRGIARRLLECTQEYFDKNGVSDSGLFTFPHSPKHVGLYQSFGYWPKHLTAIMSRAVPQLDRRSPSDVFSALPQAARLACLDSCRALTDSLHPGLDLRREIIAADAQGLGETILQHDDDGALTGFAVCHTGAGSEGGSGVLYLKFAAVRTSLTAAQEFGRLLDDCEALAAARGAKRLTAGVNTARGHAYRQMLAGGFRSVAQGVAMERGRGAAYNNEDCWVIDDWR